MKMRAACLGLFPLVGLVLMSPSPASALTPTPSPAPTVTPTPPPVELSVSAAAVTASTVDGANVAANVIDNNVATRWSGFGDGAWLRIDLGAPRSLALVKIAVYDGNHRRNRFDLQVSDNGTTWTTVFSGQSSGTTTAEETYDFPDRLTRYVRYLGHGSNVGAWNSVTEISVFGAGRPSPVCSATPSATTVAVGQSFTLRASCNLGLVQYGGTIVDVATGQAQSETSPIVTPARLTPIQVSSGSATWTVTAAAPGRVYFRIGANGEFFDPTCNCFYFTTGSAQSVVVTVQ
jgi:hypothetical protein